MIDMPKSNIIITGTEGRSGHSSADTAPSISVTAAEQSEVTNVYRVINQMVEDDVIKDYALGGAMGAFFYIESSFTSDMDIFCILAYEAHPSGLVLLTPINTYLESKGYKTTGIGAIIEGVEVQFQFPADSLGEASIQNAITHDVGGIPVKVMSPEYLVAHMLKTNRNKDRLRLLRFIEAKAFDPAAVYQILSEHGLEELYATLERLEHEGI